MRTYGAVLAAALLLQACSSETTVIDGRFAGLGQENIYLEKLLPGNTTVIDSMTTDKNGNFRFKVSVPDTGPMLYNIRYNDDAIPLLLERGEKVKINSLGNIAYNYTVSGSEGSAQLRELKTILTGGAMRLDSILNVYAAADETARQQVGAQYTMEYYKTKREHIKFLVVNSGSISSVFALYQRLPNDSYLNDGETDLIYYRMVADSIAVRYPRSPYLAALEREIETASAEDRVSAMLAEKLAGEPESYPDIELSDMYGNKHRLSSLDGKVILLDFWSVNSSQGNMNNAEYKEIYTKEAGRGFEIYQVSVDESKAVWVNAVQDQKLPWITVNDFRGAAGIAVLAYNVRSVPTNFLIDREGNIVDKNIYGDLLAEKVAGLLR